MLVLGGDVDHQSGLGLGDLVGEMTNLGKTCNASYDSLVT
jgi:hypothetical protein